ncbi:MAG: BMP family ABC transporter substrate-binding protein [Oscillospiraceae bacterium]|nr:BMP family ABC transporter substrate-binding protein [Oscillospiraceae bacterium]
MISKWLKGIAGALVLCVTLCLTGCGGETSDESSSDSSGIEEETVPVKVGYIFHDKADDGGVTGQFNLQRQKAARRCDVETVYIEDVSVKDFESAVKALVSDGCTEIVSCSSTFTNALSSISSRYMNVKFINYGATSIGTANVFSFTETAYQGAYVAGIAAAYNSKSQKVGLVADPELLYTYATTNAAALGVRMVFANGTLCVAGATENTEIKQAVDALLDEGCDVIICYTESPYTADYCEQKGVKFIGNLDYSGSEDNYKNMLMYYYAKRDSLFVSQFKQLKMDTWQPDVYKGAMSNGIINVSEAQPCADKRTQDIIDEIVPLLTSEKAMIFSGEIKDTLGNVRYMQTDTMTDAQIYSMDWYVLGVEPVGNFRKPHESPTNSFEIKS